MQRDHLLRLIDVLNPDDEPGRLTLIHRMGANEIEAMLPSLLKTVKDDGRAVLWVCDPMHGNTEKTSNGYKTRRFDNIASELDDSPSNSCGGRHPARWRASGADR